MLRWLGVLAFLSCVLCASRGFAQQGGARLRMGTGAVLDFGGSADLNVKGQAAKQHTDLKLTAGLRVHAEYDLMRYLSVGGFARASWWQGDELAQDRNLLVDVGPRATVHYDFRDFRFYFVLMPGLTISSIQNDATLNVKNPAYGFALSLGPGVEYWFHERVGMFAEAFGFSGHYFGHDAPQGGSVSLKLGQVLGQVGVTFALSEPEQGRPRRDYAADDRRARRMFSQGKTAFDHGRYERALGSFRDAYSLSPRPRLLYNIAKAEDKLGRLGEAREHYLLFLAAEPGADKQGEVRQRLQEIDAQVGIAPLTVASPAEAARSSMSKTVVPFDPNATPERAPVRSERVYKKWWFWASVGAVLAGGITASVMALKHNDTGEPARYDANTRVVGL
jgi:tetratricopeptide (TPR) repeat protein